MTDIETPDYDIDKEAYSERGESSVTVTWPVEIEERISTDWDRRYDAEMKAYGDSYTEVAHKGTYSEHQRLGNSLVNIDAYLDPAASILVDAPTEWVLEGTGRKRNDTEPPHRVAKRIGAPELSFDIYQHELVEAAKKRAAEDFTHHLRVLAEWFNRAAPANSHDAYDEYENDVFRRTLEDEAEKQPHVSWIVKHGGDPDDWRHDSPPVGNFGADDETHAETLALGYELKCFQRGGFPAVEKARADSLEADQ